MPFLRINRDKRGYEHTFLMHAFRRRGQPRPTILYWFRTPPNVKVGRAAFDEEAIRSLEERHPDLIFDWPRILETPARSDRPFEESRPARIEPRRRSGTAASARPIEPTPPIARPVDIEPAQDKAADEPLAMAERASSLEAEVNSGSDVVSSGLTPNSPEAAVAAAHPSGILSSEQLFVLRGRCAELQARVSERITDPGALESLRAEASKLDPDTWVTADEVRQHLETYELVYQSLRTALGDSRRRRSRRGGTRHRRTREGGPEDA